ncbi:hypothetical protein [Streptomyces sp. NPDC046261]|uniref:hypothetical protein n=1 Tax=Streptomyces sp. NPDC046261 TaxID=3157200 RepID=UPI00341049E3
MPATAPGLSWASHTNLEGGFVELPCVALNADDRVQVICRYVDNGLGHRWHNRDLSWSAWETYGEVARNVTGSPAARRDAAGLINIFWRVPDGGLWWMRQREINAGWTSPAQIAADAAGDPAAGLNADGRISVLYNDTGRRLSHVYQQRTDYKGWSTPRSLGGDAGTGAVTFAPAVARSGDGRLHAFVTTATNDVHAVAQTEADAVDAWGRFVPVSAPGAGVTGGPSAANDADQRIRVFWRAGTTGHHTVQRAGYSAWEPPQSLVGGIVETPRAVLAQDGVLEAFSRNTAASADICVARQKAVNSVEFSAFETFNNAGWSGGPVPAVMRDNRIVLLLRYGNKLYSIPQQ